jgi:hypothetical protein
MLGSYDVFPDQPIGKREEKNILFDNPTQILPNDLHTTLLLALFNSILRPIRQTEVHIRAVGLFPPSQSLLGILGYDVKNCIADLATNHVDEIADLVREKPVFESGKLGRVGLCGGKWDLVRVEGTFD